MPGKAVSKPSIARPNYPEPAIVIGVGRVGLAVLNRLGEDWRATRDLRHDESLRNLRMLHITSAQFGEEAVWRHPLDIAALRRPADPDCRAEWQKHEQPLRQIVRCMGEGDLPDGALDFAILRACGFVRFRDGQYEVARPIELGVHDLLADEAAAAFARATQKPHLEGDVLPVRVRTVRWLPLAADPLVSLENLSVRRQQDVVLDRCLGRTVYRVRAGHSPRILTAVLSRMMAWLEARDPSPWAWIAPLAEGEAKPGTVLRVALERTEGGRILAGRIDAAGLSDLNRDNGSSAAAAARARGETPAEAEGFDLPALFVPHPGDMATPWTWMHDALLVADHFDCFDGTETAAGRGAARAHVLPVLDCEHGFFDEDAAGWYATACTASGEAGTDEPPSHRLPIVHFQHRLFELGELCRQGLVRMWDRLSKQQTRKANETAVSSGRSESLQRALVQSLELLGDTVIRHVLACRADNVVPLEPIEDRTLQALPCRADEKLRERTYWQDPGDVVATQTSALRERLLTLGQPVQKEPARRVNLLSEVLLRPEDVAGDLMLVADADDAASDGIDDEPVGQAALRQRLVEIAENLYDLEHLRKWRHVASRRSPRLAVFVVGDLAEPFVRAALPTTLRMAHAILMRALGPVFVQHRSGLDRALHIVPLVSFPNPASPGQALGLQPSRELEALIVETLQIVRRKLEVAPIGATNVAHVMLQSRVTENAVHGIERTIETFRDFVTLFSRNDLSAETDKARMGMQSKLSQFFLRRGRKDVFATCTLSVAELPENQLRWYFGNRMARKFMELLASDGGQRSDIRETEGKHFEAATAAKGARDRLTAAASSAISEVVKHAETSADQLRTQIATPVSVDTDGEALARENETTREASERQMVQTAWGQLTDQGATVDAAFSRMRADASSSAQRDAAENRAAVDKDITDTLLARRGIAAVNGKLRKLLDEANRGTRDQAEVALRARRACKAHGVPNAEVLDSTRGAIIEAARAKPDVVPIRVLSWVWLGVLGVIGAPLLHSIAKWGHLDEAPNGLEMVLGPLAMAPAALFLALPLLALLLRHLRKRTEALQCAVQTHGDAAAALFAAESGQSARQFLVKRVEAAREAAWFGYLSVARAGAASDFREVGRLQRSVDATRNALQRQCERRGVRQVRPATELRFAQEDTSRFLSGDHADVRQWLLEGSDVADIYVAQFNTAEQERNRVDNVAQRIIVASAGTQAESRWSDFGRPVVGRDLWASRIVRTGDVSTWRKEAWLADVDALVEAFSRNFDLLQVADSQLHHKLVERNLERFLMSVYSNIGFAAQFRGFEGLDSDDLTVTADARIVLAEGLVGGEVLGKLRSSGQKTASGTSRPRFELAELPLLSPACWLVSFAHDIQIDSLQNLRRFEHHFERARPPEDRLFPYTPQGYFPDDSTLATQVPLTLTLGNRAFLAAVRRALGVGAPATADTATYRAVTSAQPSEPPSQGRQPQALADPGETRAQQPAASRPSVRKPQNRKTAGAQAGDGPQAPDTKTGEGEP